ncbi:hypothetical protein GLYMA_05G180550v4 [Glycine max]|nr:hypothetical protein GLYMA_05G180550v4 [Glycine max]KAH1135030.1 hypothetical protein GYH30_013038 [Glycine max]
MCFSLFLFIVSRLSSLVKVELYLLYCESALLVTEQLSHLYMS